MKLKLDLHPIFNDSAKIEASLAAIIDDAIAKRATEVEIIPGKGSGALKKTVIRFLDRADIKAKYHRLEKDSDNWGRLFVHFRHDRTASSGPAPTLRVSATVECVCCQAPITVPADDAPVQLTVECPSCASPNLITLTLDFRGKVRAKTDWGYGSDESPSA
ncbi:MAG TPA: Smr/MutS family protein [Capsulimonadaceae bacterium]|jgi:hypothetical protein